MITSCPLHYFFHLVQYGIFSLKDKTTGNHMLCIKRAWKRVFNFRSFHFLDPHACFSKTDVEFEKVIRKIC